MSVQAVNNDIRSNYIYPYKKKKLVSIKPYPDFDEYKYEVPASDGKKAGLAIASLCLPGLGQIANGELDRGATFALVSGGCMLGSVLLGSMFLKKDPITQAVSKKPSNSSMLGLATVAAGYLAGVATWLYSAIDAYKTAKSEVVEIAPKDKQIA